MSDHALLDVANDLLQLQQQDRQLTQLRYYQPVSDRAKKIHLSIARTIGIGGGNGASKTESALVEMCIRATGVIPLSLKDEYPREKLRGPIQCRVVCESLTTTLIPVILPKLQWWRWIGPPEKTGGDQGHWGWIPKACLIKGEWKSSWTERTRTLRLLYRDPDNFNHVVGESSIQFNSYDQDPSDFASGDFHFVLHDEPPPRRIYEENRARVMRTKGTLMLAMTWPSDPVMPVDWLFDEIYDKAQDGPHKDPRIDWFNLFTTENPNIDQTGVAERAGQMSETERAVRIYGQPIRFSNRIHPLFTDVPRYWCTFCKKDVIASGETCTACEHQTVFAYCHVDNVEAHRDWPCVFVLDPHPRKPHMMLWVQVTPNDDLEQVAEAEVPGGPDDVKRMVEEIESSYGWSTVRRMIDPNMGRSPSGAVRELTWQDEFDRVGLTCDLADDSDVGRARLNDYLTPQSSNQRPRYVCDSRNTSTILQLKRYVWDEYRRNAEHDIKQKPKAKYDDFPTCLKYLMNSDPSFRGLRHVGQVFKRVGGRGEHGY